jgi:glutathione S-transferase
MLKIYGAPISVHTRKAILVAELKGLPYEVVPVVPVIPASLPRDWHALSPTGLIPVLVDDDFTIADSTAICTYLELAYPHHAVYPKSPRERAQVLSLEAYAGEMLFRSVVRVLFHEVFVHPRLDNRPTDSAAVNQVLQTTLPEVFGYLDGAAAAGFLVGDAMSVADIAVTSNLLTFMYLGFDLDRDRCRHLAALFDRVVAHPAVREALRAELPVVDSMGLRGDFLKRLMA